MTTITLELPQNIYEPLQKAAAKAGQSPQELITKLLVLETLVEVICKLVDEDRSHFFIPSS
jgi:hypothetical protein